MYFYSYAESLNNVVVSTMYNFTNSGEDTYSIEPLKPFYVVDNSSNDIITIHPDVVAHTAKISGKLAVSRPVVEKRASYNGCSSAQQSQISSAIPAAKTYASNAATYLSSHSSSSTRYTTWFGTYTSARHSVVESHFSNIAGNDFPTFTYDCTCQDTDVYAYVFPDE